MKIQMLIAGVLAAHLVSLTNTAGAHGIWLAQRTDELTVVYGHLAEDGAYKAKKVKSIEGFTATGEKRAITLALSEKNVKLTAPDDVVVLSTVFDNGFWIKGADGKWQNVGKQQVAGGTESHQPLKYNTHILKSPGIALKPTGAPLEIVPLTDPIALKLGDDLPVQVYLNGKPLAGASVINDYINNAEAVTKADGEGKATLKVTSAGLNVIGVEFSEKTPTNPDVDEIFNFATLSYTLPHVE